MVHIVDRLREDYTRFAELFERIRQTVNGSSERRGNLVRVLGHALAANAAFKETVFYPAVREGGNDEATEAVAKAVSDHHEAERLLEHLDDMEPASAEFSAAIRELEGKVRRQAEREEEHIFPLALQVIGRYEAEEMSERHDAMAQVDA